MFLCKKRRERTTCISGDHFWSFQHVLPKERRVWPKSLPPAVAVLTTLVCWESSLAPRQLHKCGALHEEVLCYLLNTQMNNHIKPLWTVRQKKKNKSGIFCLWTEKPFYFKCLAWQSGLFSSFPKYTCVFKPWWDLLNSFMARYSFVPSLN